MEEVAIQTDPHRDGICGPGERARLQRWRLELKLGSATCLPWDSFLPSLRQPICEVEAAVFKQSVDEASSAGPGLQRRTQRRGVTTV